MRLILLVAAVIAGVGARAHAQTSPNPPTSVRVEPWDNEIAAFEAADRVHPPPKNAVLFVGSSSIRLWPNIKQAFRGVTVLQRGFGGTDLDLVNYYVPRVVIPYRPRLIVLYAGDNDIAQGRAPEGILQEFKKFVSLVRHDLPAVPIVFISIKPSRDRWSFIDNIRATNELVRKYAETVPGITYVDVFSKMLGPDGLPRKDIFTDDNLHMNERGYALWRKILYPIVRDTSTPVKRREGQ